MKKTKKALASLAIAGMVTSLVPTSVLGADAVTRIAGNDRIQTAIAIAANGWTAADSVIVVPADNANIVDALAAAPLAGKLNAPILMTFKGELDPAVKAKIADLKAKNVYAIGALSDAVVAGLKTTGASVTQLKGADRMETAALVAAQLGSPAGSFVVAYNGVADAMSAASFAAANGYAILIADPNGNLPAIEAPYKGAKVYTVGGQVSIAGATALKGADRYATNSAVIGGLTFNYDKVYVANGESLVDALAGAPLAAKTKSPIVLANAYQAATGANASITDNTAVIALGGVGVVSQAVLGQVSNKPAAETPAPAGEVAVTSATATAANTIKVVFAAAPADTAKVTFAVTRGTVPITTTVAWNAAKTEATLTTSYSMPEGTYNVAVKDADKDLGSKAVEITAQKVAKIEFTSTKLGVASKTVSGETYARGYASYKVFDQYGNDITTSYLAKNIVFQSGAANSSGVTGSDGLLTIKPNINMSTLTSVVVTASDQTSGTTANATLSVSTALGTLSDIKLNKITNVENKVLTDRDTTSVFYIDYTATDLSGNPTKDLELVKNGLITQTLSGVPDYLTSSLSQVTAQVVADPMDSKKAAIEVKVNGSYDAITMDMPLTITAMSYSGTTSTLNTTLKKAATPDVITLMAPAYEIAIGEKKEIPFEVYDQNGAKITKYSDMVKTTSPLAYKFTLNGSLTLEENADGTARMMVQAQASKGTQFVSVTTENGKLSSLNLNIVDAPKADTLEINTSKLVTAVQAGGAVQKLDGGWFRGGVTVKDQYGRPVDTWTLDASNKLGQLYRVDVTSNNTGVITATGSAGVGTPEIVITSVAAGSATVTFDLKQINEYNAAGTLVALTTPVSIATKAVSFSVIKDDDITGYTMDAVADPIYTIAPNNIAWDAAYGVAQAETMRQANYAAAPKIYATTSTGTKVLPKNFTDLKVYLDSSDFFYDTDADNFVKQYATTPQAFDGIRIIAKDFTDSAKTGSSTNVTATFTGADGKTKSLSTVIKSTTASPVAKSLNLFVSKERNGVTVNDAMDEITIYSTNGGLSTISAGRIITRWDAAGDQGTYSAGVFAGRAPFYFYAVDQYGSRAQELAQIIVTPDATTGNTITFAADGTIASHNLVAGDTIRISAVTKNGLIKTIKVVVK